MKWNLENANVYSGHSRSSFSIEKRKGILGMAFWFGALTLYIRLIFIENDRIAKIFMIANFEIPTQALLEHKYRKEHAFSPNDSSFII